MLSFLREQSLDDLPAQKKPASAAGTSADAEKNIPDQGFLTVATDRRQVRRSTMLLAVVFVVGLLCIWFMVRKTSPQTAEATAADVNEIDMARAMSRITGGKAEMFDRMDEIVNKFYEFSEVLQVKVSELVKNPFELETFLAGLKAKADAAEQVLEIDTDAIRKQQIKQQAQQLKFLSIMKAEHAYCCMIEGKILYEGDSVDDFKVSGIGSNFVKLLWDPKDESARLGPGSQNVEIVLKLSQ
jgi:hypothetical protein